MRKKEKILKEVIDLYTINEFEVNIFNSRKLW